MGEDRAIRIILMLPEYQCDALSRGPVGLPPFGGGKGPWPVNCDVRVSLKENFMFKKLVVLASLVPGLAGCIVTEGGHHGHGGPVIIAPIHAHCIGCQHVYRGGVWIRG